LTRPEARAGAAGPGGIDSRTLWCFQSVIRLFFMKTKKFMNFQEDDMFIGWLDDFPDYKTQGATLDELKENLRDIYEELTSGSIPT
jgi:hypothetical protein